MRSSGILRSVEW